MPLLKAWNGSNWNTEVDEIKAWNGSNWNTDVLEVKAWNGSTWVSVWIKSDPLTLTFYPSWTASYETASPYDKPDYTFPDIEDTVIQGDWEGIGSSDGNRDWNGCINFNGAAIRSAFGGRTVVSSVRLRLTNRQSAEPQGTPVKLYKATNLPASEPANLNVTRSGSEIAGPTIDVGETMWVPSGSGMISIGQDILNGTDRGIALYDAASNPIFRGYFWGTNGANSQKPQLEITADYV